MSKDKKKSIKEKAMKYLDYIISIYGNNGYSLVTGNKDGEIIRLKVYDSGLVTEC